MSKHPQTSAPNDQYAETITIGEKIAYGGGDLASNLILVLTSTFVTFFYTDALGLNAGIIGTIMLLSRVFDGFTDIFMGFVMDQVKSKHGKTRCWLLWLAIPIALSTVLVFLVPNIGATGQYIFVAITYNLVTTFGAKIGAGVGMSIAMSILSAASYDGLAAVQAASAVSAIRNLYLLAPLPFLIALPIFYAFYRLDKIYPQVMADLEKREQAGKQ